MAIRISGMVSGLDTDSIVQELVSAQSTRKESLEKAQTKLDWTMDTWKDMNSKIYGFYSKSLSNMRFSTSFSEMKKSVVSDETKASVVAGGNVPNGTQTFEINQLAKAGYLTGGKLSESGTVSGETTLGALGVSGSASMKLTVGGVEKTVEINDTMTVNQLTTALRSAGVNASFDSTQQRFILSSKASGENNDFNFDQSDVGTATALTALGLNTEAGAVKQAATNSIIILNGATFETDSNTLTVNGLTINAKAETTSAISVTTETDIDGIYNMIKDFIGEYNTLINEMDKAYNAPSAKGYEPLTEKEKDTMTEREIDKWEDKIKESLLRKDSTLNSVAQIFKTSMQESIEIGEEKLGLSSFGINTLGYFVSAENEKNAFYIDGDPDNENGALKTNKLKEALATDPSTVTSFFTQLAKGLYDELTTRMKSTSMNSIYKVYNDKQMQKDYDDYGKKVKTWEEKVKDMENYYYKKFAAMEKALSVLESSTSALSSLMGMNQN